MQSNFQRFFVAAALAIFLIVMGGYTSFHFAKTSLLNPGSDTSPAAANQQVSQKASTKPSLTPPTPTPSPKPSIQVMFGGDLMYDRHIRQFCQENGYQFPLSQLHSLLNQQDLVVANLEGPVTANQSVSVNTIPGTTNNFIFTFDPQAAPALTAANIKLVNLGNNHILNFGSEGYRQTLEYLDQEGINYYGQIGSQVSADSQQLSYIYEQHDFKIGFVNYNQFADTGLEPALAEIERIAPQTDWVVVTPHWGNEYVYDPNDTIKSWAQQLVDAGADLVIGAHPHVIQVNEVYQGKRIYYSLGNFVFDQYFQPEVMEGLLVQVTFSSDGLKFKEYPIQLRPTGQTELKPEPTSGCSCGR